MKKIKLNLSESQMKALLFMINFSGINLQIIDISEMALKEQYTKLFIRLQTRCLNLKPKNNIKFSYTEAFAIDAMKVMGLFTGFELNTLNYILREIDQQIVNLS